MKRAVILLASMIVLAVGSYVGVRAWRKEVLVRQEQRAFDKARELLKSGEPLQALVLQQTQARPGSNLDWPTIQLQSLIGLRDLGRLTQIFEREPARIVADEEASLLVAHGYLHGRRPADLEKVRKTWRGRETRHASWLVLDSDALVIAGKGLEAEKWLRAHPLPGTNDAVRLTRLAILVAKKNLTEAWQLLAQAAELTPRDADLRLFRGQIMEGLGRMEAARFEYASAVLCRTNDAFVRDELAEFYRRQGKYPLAIQTWTEAMPNQAPDYFWLKAGFWSRVVSPTPLDATTVSTGDLKPLAQWVVGLPSGRFFDTNSFALLADRQRYIANRQEVHWLELLDLLQRGDEKGAMELLGFSKFRANSWEPDLETAVLRILQYRQKRTLQVSTAGLNPVGGTNQHQFLIDLNRAAVAEAAGTKGAINPELDAVLRGPDAFAAAFLAVGWREAALQLHRPGHPATAHPMWLAYGFAESLRSNRDAAAALEFLAQQAPSPELELLKGELLIQLQKSDEGLARLRPLASAPSPVGQRASYILALADLDRLQFDTARRWVTNQPLLVKNPMGQELLARAALGQGKAAEADTIYGGIAGTSIEAKAHLARSAFARKDWIVARRWTRELLALMPDSVELRSNLAEIDKASGNL